MKINITKHAQTRAAQRLRLASGTVYRIRKLADRAYVSGEPISKKYNAVLHLVSAYARGDHEWMIHRSLGGNLFIFCEYFNPETLKRKVTLITVYTLNNL